MKLSDVVGEHGFIPSELGQIDQAKLYERQNADGILEILCIQKIGNAMRVDRQPLIAMEVHSRGQSTFFLPIGQGIKNQLILTENLEEYLNSTLPTNSNRNTVSL